MIKPAKGKRQCNCKNKMVTKQLGPGMFQQFQTQECEQCSNVKFARESETLQVTVEPGMKDNEVPLCCCKSISHTHAHACTYIRTYAHTHTFVLLWRMLSLCCIGALHVPVISC